VYRCVLVFVGDGTPAEVVLDGAALAQARRTAQQAAHDLLAEAGTPPGLR
jgi:hypothetical protein